MIQDVAKTLSLFRRSWAASLGYAVGVQVLRATVLGPVLLWCGYKLVATSGDPAVSNFDLIGFALSVPGVVYLAAWLLVSVAVSVLNYGGLVYLAADAHEGRPPSLWSAWTRALRALPRVI